MGLKTMEKKNDYFEIEVDVVSEKDEKRQEQKDAVKDSAAALAGAISNLATSKVKDAEDFIQNKASDISKAVEGKASGVNKIFQEKADDIGKSIQSKTAEISDKIQNLDKDAVTSEDDACIKQTVTVETIFTEGQSTDTDIDYVICDNCGAIVPLGSAYCENCGEAVCNTATTKNNEAHEYVRVLKQKRRKKLLAGALAVLVAGAGVNVGVDEFTKVEVPGVEGLSAYAAEEQLIQAGYETDEIIIECDGVLTKDEVQHGEYEVVSQEPVEGEKVHTSDTIHLLCIDNQKIRVEEMTACRYEKVPEVLSVADSYNYTYELNDLNGKNVTEQYAALSAIDQEKYYIYEQTEFNDNRRITEYTIDTEENIENSIKDQFEKIEGDTVADANKLANSLDFTISCKNEDGSNSESSNYVFTGVTSVSIVEKKASITADSKEHIEELALIKTLADKIPYEGLKEKYIAETSIGDYDRTEDDYENYDLNEDQTAYYWTSDDGKYDALEVICEDGEVKKVKKLNEEVYWTSSKPDFSADKDEYDAKIAAAAAAQAEKETMVWIPRTGSCYHSNQYCSNMKNPSQVTISQAQNLGYRACSKCY